MSPVVVLMIVLCVQGCGKWGSVFNLRALNGLPFLVFTL